MSVPGGAHWGGGGADSTPPSPHHPVLWPAHGTRGSGGAGQAAPSPHRTCAGSALATWPA